MRPKTRCFLDKGILSSKFVIECRIDRKWMPMRNEDGKWQYDTREERDKEMERVNKIQADQEQRETVAGE